MISVLSDDILNDVFCWLNDIVALVHVSRVCTIYRSVFLKYSHDKRLKKLANRTKILYRMCPRFKWDIHCMIGNKDLDIQFFRDYPRIKLGEGHFASLVEIGCDKKELIQLYNERNIDVYDKPIYSDITTLEEFISLTSRKEIPRNCFSFASRTKDVDALVEYISTNPKLLEDTFNQLLTNSLLERKHIDKLGIIPKPFQIELMSRYKNLVNPLKDTDLQWNFSILFHFRVFTVEEIVRLKNIYPTYAYHFNWNMICAKTPMTWQEFCDIVPLNYKIGCFKTFLKYGNISVDDIETIFDWPGSKHFSLLDLLINHSIPLSMLPSDRFSADHYNHILENPNLTIDFIHKHHKFFDSSLWAIASRNLGIKLEDIFSNMQYKWKMRVVCSRLDITMKIILDNRHINFDWDSLSENPSITVVDIIKNKNLPWNHSILSRGITRPQ